MCCNLRCSKLQGGFPEPFPTPTQPGRPEPAAEASNAESRTQTHLLSLPRVQVRRGRKPRSKLPERSEPQSRPGRDRLLGSASRPAAQINTRDFLPGLPSSRPQPSAGLPRPPCTCGDHGLALALLPGIRIHAAGCWPGVHSRPSVCGALGAGVPRRTQCGQPGGSKPRRHRLGSERRPRPGGGSAEASATRAPLPTPAGRCLRARRAPGRGWGRAARARGGGRGGASREERERPAPGGLQTGVK